MPVYAHTSEEAKANGRKGGIASGKARRDRKTLKQELITLLETGETQKKISLALIQQALEGNTKAFEVIRDSIGEKPKDQIEQQQEIVVKMGDKLSEWGK